MSNTKHFADLMKVCSILPALLVMPAIAEVPEGFVESTEQSISEPTNIVGKTYENLYVRSPENTPVEDQKLTNLFFAHKGQTSTISNSVFKNNNAEVGGALATTGGGGNQSEVIVKNSSFSENSALYDAGAIGNYGFLTIGEGVVFKNNTSVNGIETVDYMGGGALGLGSLSTTKIDDDTKFIENYSGTYGGAIATRRSENGDNHAAKLDIKGDFERNEAKYRGGAIYNTFYNGLTDGTGVTVDADFVRNHAGQSGGAIYNDGVLDKSSDKSGAVMTINDSDFEYNTAGVNGGAIYNTGKLTIVDSDFVGNSALEQGGAINSSEITSELYISKSKFENNKIIGDTEKHQLGGAIKISGIAEIKDTDFINNYAAGWAGAIYAGNKSDVKLSNVLFQGNTSAGVGALGLYKDGQLKNVRFVDNHATDFDSGALFLGAVSSTYVDGTVSDSYFEGNSAATIGGAIGTRIFAEGYNKDAYLDIRNTTFVNNVAGTNGGAIANNFYHSYTNPDAVYVENGVFSGNSAQKGGAVYNHGAESAPEEKEGQSEQRAAIEFNGNEFTGNSAIDLGGAIYNETEANVFLSGNNTFTGNTANGVANDIHNLGTVTIASGMTSIYGGITGDGILNIEEGATLNMNYASIEQGTINLDGTLMASLLNANDTLDVSGDLAGDGRITLNVGAAGVYDLSAFKGYVDPASFGKTFDVSVEDGIATVTAKNAQAVAAATGMSMGSAGAISTLAVSTDAKLQQVSLKAQEVLNSGNTALVEKEMAKLNPDSKPIAHSVASSVQNQVVTVAAGRMSAVAGRAGGDVTAAGVWAQGLFNKSKLNGQFHGYTRGFALGGDTLIDNKYTIGGGFAFNNTDVHADGRHMDVDSTSVFVYGQYKPADWYVNATINYTMSEYADNANVFGSSFDNEYDTNAFGAQAMYGYNFASGVTPEFGLRYLHVNQEEHKILTGDGVKMQEMNTDFLSGVAGVKYAFDIENDWEIQLRPELRAAMTYDLMSDDSVATIVVPGAASYYVDVDRLSRLGGEFGIGLTAEYRGLEVSLNYELDLHKDYTSQTGLLKFRYNF